MELNNISKDIVAVGMSGVELNNVYKTITVLYFLN